MNIDYKGTLYIKACRKYVPLTQTVEYFENLEKENERLRKQVDKMKNSRNCQTWNEWQCPYARDNKDKDYNLITDREKCPCDKWRIKE